MKFAPFAHFSLIYCWYSSDWSSPGDGSHCAILITSKAPEWFFAGTRLCVPTTFSPHDKGSNVAFLTVAASIYAVGKNYVRYALSAADA